MEAGEGIFSLTQVAKQRPHLVWSKNVAGPDGGVAGCADGQALQQCLSGGGALGFHQFGQQVAEQLVRRFSYGDLWYRSNQDRAVAEGDSKIRVQATIFPEDLQNRDKGAAAPGKQK